MIQADVLLKSDHLPLKQFLQRNTLNSKVNNWAMELESFNIQFEHIKGQNVLADTLSCLIDIDPDTQLTPEGNGYEFGYAVFEELPDIHPFKINEVIAGDKEIKNDPDLHDALQCIDNLIAPERLKCLQEQDATIEMLKHKLTHNKLDKEYYSIDENGLLTRKVMDDGHEFCTIYLSAVLVLQVLWAAHDDLGHNGFPRTYAALKQVFYWKGMKENIRDYCKMCTTCTLHRSENIKFERKVFHPSLLRMDFICMDLIGEFHPPTSCGHCYAQQFVCLQDSHGVYH